MESISNSRFLGTGSCRFWISGGAGNEETTHGAVTCCFGERSKRVSLQGKCSWSKKTGIMGIIKKYHKVKDVLAKFSLTRSEHVFEYPEDLLSLPGEAVKNNSTPGSETVGS